MKLALAGLAVAFVGAASAQPPVIEGSTILGGPATYTFDTLGTVDVNGGTPDTELAIWDANGILLAENDDATGLGLLSQIDIFLDEGVYFLGVSEFNSVWGDGFTNTGSNFEDGDLYDVELNADGVLIGAATIGFVSATGFDSRNVFFRVEVVPAPASAGLLAASGLLARRRR